MLQYILSQVAPGIGLSLANASEKAWMVQQINKAAKELYEGRDLVNVEREQLFALEGDDQQITMPYYVEQIRGVKRHNTRERLNLTDMRPRYKTQGWAESLLTWREKWKSPLKNPITTEAPVTLSIQDVEASAFTVIVTGSSPHSARITEAVTFAAGETEKVTTNPFSDITGFLNLTHHTYDVVMEDAEGVELSVLPNVADRAQYILLQVMDGALVTMEQPYLIEVLYKTAFLFMRNDYDEFVCPGYDDAIAWQTIGNCQAKHKPDEARLAFEKVRQILKGIDNDRSQSKDKTISFEGDGTNYPFGYPSARRFGLSAAPHIGLFPGADRP